MSGGGRCFEGIATTAGITNQSVSTVLFGAIAGGAGAALTGGCIWQGAVTGGIVAGLNHLAHDGGDGPGDPKKAKPKEPKYNFEKRVGKNSEVLSRLPENEDGGTIDNAAENMSLKENTIKWVSHGSRNGIAGGMTADKFHDFLYNNSAMYKSAIDNYTPLRLELYACYVGDYGGLAEQLSIKNPNLTIQAANYTIQMSPTGNHYVGDKGGYRFGFFNIYQNGTIINTANFKIK